MPRISEKKKMMRQVAKQSVLAIAFTLLVSLVICASNSEAHAQILYASTSASVTASPPLDSTSPSAQLLHNNNNNNNLRLNNKNAIQSRQSYGDMINDIQIECNSDNIVVTLNTNQGFNGMIYPKGLSKNSSCMVEYHQTTNNITYYLPLRSCNTMSSDVEDGVEYFNTVMVQPHRRLVTNQGRGYHIRCRYQTKERTVTNQDQQLSVNLTQLTPPVIGSAAVPSCSMKIFAAHDLSREVAAENVRIGDELHLTIALDDQDVYGMLVTNCLVRDGMNWGEQPLLDDHGCPVDEDIMPQFVYAANLTRASVAFQAHKFPYTSSVYYQCNVRLCFRDGGCQHVPPTCSGDSNTKNPSRHYKQLDSNHVASRRRRWVDGGELDATASEELLKPKEAETRAMSIEVFSGLHVDESELEAGAMAAGPGSSSANVDEAQAEPMMMAATSEEGVARQVAAAAPQTSSRQSERDFCMSLRKFAIAISLASLLLMTAIIIMVACMIQRRKRQRMEEEEEAARQHRHHHHHQQSIYDHHQLPYSNRGYCRD